MILTSYHNHTNWSDGASTVAEMIEAARDAGLAEFGISDHYALTPGNARLSWALAPESLDAYVGQIQQARASSQGMIIRLGLEVDYFPETIEETRKRLAAHPFDYLIGSVHFADSFPIDFEARGWEGLPQDDRDRVWRNYWKLLREAAQSGLFDIIGHFDLPKKFNFHSSVDLTADALLALDAMAEADLAIEINTSGWDRPAAEAYPALFYLQEACRRKIPLVISSDAHAAGEVCRHFDRALKFAAEAGYNEVVRFENRRRSSHALV